MYTPVFKFVFVYTTASVVHSTCDISNPARGHTVSPEKLLIRPLVEKNGIDIRL